MVSIKKKAVKAARELPAAQHASLQALIVDLEKNGPIRGNWPNYSKLGAGEHHCHLSYRYVACWRENGNELELEVYYVGTRENAPY